MGSGASKKAVGSTAVEVKPAAGATGTASGPLAAAPKAGRPPVGPKSEKPEKVEKPQLPHENRDADGTTSVSSSGLGEKKYRPLSQAKVENEEVEEAMAEAISQSSPKKSPKAPKSPSPRGRDQQQKGSKSNQDSPAPTGLEKDELVAACRFGNFQVVKAFLESITTEEKHLEGRIPSEALLDDYGESLLHHAAHGGHREVVRILLELGQVQADIPNASNETALSVACRRGDGAVAMELLKADANPNRMASDGLTPFLAAVIGAAEDDFLDALLHAKADLNAQDHRGVGAMHSLALSGNMRLMKWLTVHSAELDLQTEHGTTALMLASKRGSQEGAALLLAAKANPNLSNKAGSTALMQAFASNLNVAFMLIENGASVDIVDSAGRSALFHAVISGEESAIEAVIRKGGRVNILDEDSRTPLYQACLMGSLSMVKMLLSADADPNLAGRGSSLRPTQAEEEQEDGAAKVLLEEARTCLQVSAMLAQNELLLCLLDHHADINTAPGSLGWSALHLCALVNNEEGAEKLLAHGAVLGEDIEGNTARMLAERAGHEGVVQLLSGHHLPPVDLKAQLPPLGSRPGAEVPEETTEEPLEYFKDEWESNVSRPANDSLLDRVFGPMVHDAMISQQWRDRWQAHIYITRNFVQLSAPPGELIQAVSQATCMAARDKMPKVFLASLSLLDELLSDARVDEIGPESFLEFLQTDEGNMINLLLDQTDVGGGSSNSTSPQQAAAGALCSCVLHGRIPLDEVAFPLMLRMEERLCALATTKEKKEKDSKTPVAAKCLAANLKLVGRIITSFGLQQSGLFRRALVLPLLLRASACEHSKVRAAAGDCLLQLLALSGGIEERVWGLLPAKAQKRVQSLAAGHEGLPLLSAMACDEDAMSKEDINAEDGRATDLVCVSELNAQIWTSLQAGMSSVSLAQEIPPSPKAAKSLDDDATFADDAAASALSAGIASKNWKQRAECIGKLFTDLATASEGVKLLKDSENQDSGPLLSQYVLGGMRISLLQTQLSNLLVDPVTAVFVNAADLLCLICSQVPLYIAPLFLEPLLPALFGRLLDTSQKVRQKSAETTLEVCSLHSSALSEMVAQCVSSSSVWTSDRSTDRSTGPRLQLLGQMVKRMHDRDSARVWSDETWSTLADYALKASENKSADVRKEASNLLDHMANVGGHAGEMADQAAAQIKAMADERAKQKMRPGTGVRPLTGVRVGTGSRPGSGALGGSGRLSTGGFNSSGRLSTANRSGSFRPGTGRPGTSLSRSGTMTLEEESDNSLHSDAEMEAGDEGVKFFDVKNACGGADEVPEVAEGEAALKEALPLAEALDEVAMDFVAPLIALFGEGWTRCFYSRNWQCRVAALTHLSAIMAQRLEDVSDAPLAELLDGCMRAVHEGLGDQNVRVYAEACMAVTAIVPSFCGTVDGRLLVAHLAPLLRQLCARMGDSKEVVRTQTTQAMFRLLSPPTGKIVSPVAIAMLILRHLMPSKEEGDSPLASVSKGATGKGAVTGWLCRLSALRQLCKEYPKMIVQQPGGTNPGEWLRLSDGLKHSDPSVRHQSVRLYTLVSKMHLRSLGDEESQRPAREMWVAALPKDVPPKSIAQVRRYLKLPEASPETESPSETKRSKHLGMTIACIPWQVPSNLLGWAGCSSEVLDVLSAPRRGDEKAVIAALKALGKGKKEMGSGDFGDAFSNICRAIQQALAAPTGADRYVFLCAVELCQSAVQEFGATLSGLDLNMALGKVFPTLLERTALSSLAGDVKVGVASDKLVQQLAKHPKVGCEAVTKMVIASISRSEHPVRQLVLLRTLLSDFGLRLCAQKDVVALLLNALGSQLESSKDVGEAIKEAIRPQLIGVLATCKQFSNETIRFCLSEVDTSQRKLLCAALAEAPDPQLMALGATAAEQESSSTTYAVGSAIRAASRSRGISPSEPTGSGGGSRPALSRHTSRSNLGKPPEAPRRAESQKLGEDKIEKEEENTSTTREASPRSTSTRRRRRIDCSPQQPRGPRSLTLNHGVLSEASTAASDFPSESPRKFGGGKTTASTPNLNKSLEGSPRPWPAKPPAPMSLSTALKGDSASWRFRDEKAEETGK